MAAVALKMLLYGAPQHAAAFSPVQRVKTPKPLRDGISSSFLQPETTAYMVEAPGIEPATVMSRRINTIDYSD